MVLDSGMGSSRRTHPTAMSSSPMSDDSSSLSSSPEAMNIDDEENSDIMHPSSSSILTPRSKRSRTADPVRLKRTISTEDSNTTGTSQVPPPSDQSTPQDLSDSVTMPGGIPPPSQAGMLSDLFHKNEKPSEPVARDHCHIVHQPSPSHHWHVRWAGNGHRHYECSCGIIVKEKKGNGHWVAHTPMRR